MKDFMKDRLILLATAQECMTEVADKIAKWDNSQLIMEKSAFESLNYSDDVMNYSKNGSILVGRLLECCQSLLKNPCSVEQMKMEAVLEELLNDFQRIREASTHINEIAHRIEAEAATQKEIEENIKKSLASVSESVDTAAACAELTMTDF